MMKISRFAASFVLAAVCAASAFADPFRVRDVAIDKTASSINEAITQGRAEARVEAARRLIDRLTLPEDRAAAGQPLDPNTVARFFSSYDFQEQERRTGTRYITVMTVNFLASDVRKYLDERNIPFVETQAAMAMIAPVASGGLDPVAWAKTWEGKADSTVLTPYVVSVEAWPRPPAWSEVEAEAGQKGAQRAVVAGAYLQNGQIYVRLSEVRGGYPESMLAIAGPFNDLSAAQRGSVAALEKAWKQASVVRTTGSTPMALVARFGGLNDWVKIRKSMESSRLISSFKVESVSTSGADISFVYSGRPDQLAADLRARGVALRSDTDGWVAEASSPQ
jgi:hypothetical protein